jgi:hypothetical protein
MILTDDQYQGLYQLRRWYSKYQHQIIDVSGTAGTGVLDLVQYFLSYTNLDPREIMWLSFNQKQVLELAYQKHHAYYLPYIIYKYDRIVDFNSIPVLNANSTHVSATWKKRVRKKMDSRYKLIIVFDSVLLSYNMLKDLSSFGLPIILLRDPMLLPAPNTYTFLREPNIELHDISPTYAKSPIIYFANKAIRGEIINPGIYDIVSVVLKKRMNLYNIKSSDMNICLSNPLRNEINQIYREKVLHRKDIITHPNEKLIICENSYNHALVNPDENKVKVYLSQGLIGYISRINKHALTTKFVPFEFRPEFYHDSFDDIILDRHYLNKVDFPVHQQIPDHSILAEYAYALTPDLARLSHWDKVTLILDQDDSMDNDLMRRMLYTAITRAKKMLTIVV